MRGPQQLLIGQARLLQLLGELAVLLQPVAFQQGDLLLHGGQLLRNGCQCTEHTAVLVPGLAQLPVLRREKPALGVGGGELGAHLGEPGRYAVEVLFYGDVAPAEQDVDGGGARNGAREQREQGQNQCKSFHDFTVACPCDTFRARRPGQSGARRNPPGTASPAGPAPAGAQGCTPDDAGPPVTTASAGG